MDNNFFPNYGIQPEFHFDLSSDCFFTTNLDNSIDQFAQFESALSSMASSPVSATNSLVSNESFENRQLIGKFSPICNSGEIPASLPCPISDQFLKPNLPNLPNLGNSIPNYLPVQGYPGFSERAAKFSCFGSRSFNGRTGQLGKKDSNEFLGYKSSPLIGNSMKLTRVLSSPSFNLCGSQMDNQENTNLVQYQVEIEQKKSSPVSTHIPDSNSKKRKTLSKVTSREAKVKEENEISKSKRLKEDGSKTKTEEEKQGNGSDNEEAKVNTKAHEAPKDYIHVRARRGEATDSHSLAERVRREKISERMKLLQDLVPGCNKVTGKALMLDEIINYVQSLQRQVEFLSMKVATVNPRLGLILTQLSHNNISNLGDPFHSTFHHNIGLQLSQFDDFSQGLTQCQTFCEDDLQSIVQMGLISQGCLGSNQTSHMKIEQ